MDLDLSVKKNLFIGTNYDLRCRMTQKKRVRTPAQKKRVRTPAQKKRVRTPARIAAERKYAEKQKGRPRLPSGMLTSAENKFCNKVYVRFGKTKKEAIIAGLRLLYEKIK